MESRVDQVKDHAQIIRQSNICFSRMKFSSNQQQFRFPMNQSLPIWTTSFPFSKEEVTVASHLRTICWKLWTSLRKSKAF